MGRIMLNLKKKTIYNYSGSFLLPVSLICDPYFFFNSFSPVLHLLLKINTIYYTPMEVREVGESIGFPTL